MKQNILHDNMLTLEQVSKLEEDPSHSYSPHHIIWFLEDKREKYYNSFMWAFFLLKYDYNLQLVTITF